MKILITGIAGFIGYHIAKRLLKENITVIGIDNLNNYYDVELKKNRLNDLGYCNESKSGLSHNQHHESFFLKADLTDTEVINDLFKTQKFDYVIHLAAQAGVRYSINNPHSYIASNISGFFNILEACRHFPVKHLIYASSSSVYGLNQKAPYSEKHNVDHPASLYAATKKSNELMAHSYSYLFNIPTTGLRFFSVYGPWGRPDMAYFSFTQKILKGEPIEVYNYGKMKRDFTYIDDIVEGITRLLKKAPVSCKDWNSIDANPDLSVAPYRICNIGNNSSVPLEEFISILEETLQKKAERKYLPAQAGDVIETYANIDSLASLTGFKPDTSIHTGLGRFISWYKNYYGIE